MASTTRNSFGRIAFITTPRFRENPKSWGKLEHFIYQHMHGLCTSFDVVATGRTYDAVMDIADQEPSDSAKAAITKALGVRKLNDATCQRWRSEIRASLKKHEGSFPGMIHITFELVEHRIDAVIHLTDWADKSGKPDSAVLSREANVHHVPIATDVTTAEAYVMSWKAAVAKGRRPFPKREPPRNRPLLDIEREWKRARKHGAKGGQGGTQVRTNKVLAMVAHDKLKLDLCCFAVKNAKNIIEKYDFVLATGTTGGWLTQFFEASGHQEFAKRIKLCESGPQGGDIQIAEACVRGLCHAVIFFQDPSVPHPHDSDIRLFEQAVLAEGVKVALATNAQSAELLLE